MARRIAVAGRMSVGLGAWACALALALTAATALASGSVAHGTGVWSARSVGDVDLRAVAFPTTERGWVAGAAGTLLTSEDAGRTWTAQASRTTASLRGLDFIDAATGWAVGEDDTVLATSDGGARWARGVTGTGAGAVLRSVDFVDRTHGWVAGNPGLPAVGNLIAVTRDGGRTWTRQVAPLGMGVASVSFADRQHGFAGGYLGAAHRTDDGGQTWVPMLVGEPGADVTAVLRLDERVGLAAAGTAVYRTGDGGTTWTRVADTGRTVRALAHAGGTAFAVGDHGTALRSDDGGRSWRAQPAGTPQHLAAVTAPAPSFAAAAGTVGTVATLDPAASPEPLDVAADLEECAPVAGGPGVAVRWTHAAAGYQVAGTSGDLTGDGVHEVVVSGTEGVRALVPGRPTAQATLWERVFQARTTRVLLADVDGGGPPAVVVASSGPREDRAGVAVLDGTSGATVWSRRLPGGASAVRAADVTGDGRDDLVAVTGGQALHVLSGADGADLLSPRALGAQPRQLQLGDLSGDGVPEAVVALADGRAEAIDLATGAQRWTYTVAGGGLETVELADLTGDGRVEAILGGHGVPEALTSPNHADTTAVGTRSGPLLVAVSGPGGRRLWDWGVPSAGSDRVYAVGAGDLTGDGLPDVVAHVAGLRTGHLVAFDGLGRRVAGVPTGEPALRWSLNTTHGSAAAQGAYTPEGLVVADGDGDGVADAYLSSWSGALLGVSGRAPDASPAHRPSEPERLFQVARRPPHTHVSLRGGDGVRELLTASGDHLVALRDPVSGAVRWSFDAGGRPALATGGLGPAGELGVAVGSSAGRAYGLDAGGALLQPARDAFLPQRTAGIAAVDVTGDGRDEIVAAAVTGTVAAFDPRTSQRLWRTSVGAGAGAVTSLGGRLIMVGTTDGRVVALDPRTGAAAWEHAGAAPVRALAQAPRGGLLAAGDDAGLLRILDEHGALRGQAVTGDGSIVGLVTGDLQGEDRDDFVAASGSTFQAFDAEGQRLWRHVVAEPVRFVSAGDLTGDGATEVVGTALDGQAHALDGRTGAARWTLPNGHPGPAAIADLGGDGHGVAVVTSPASPEGHRTVRTVDADGTVRSRCRTRKAPHAAHVVDLDGDGADEVLIAMQQGDVYAFASSAGVPPAPPGDGGDPPSHVLDAPAEQVPGPEHESAPGPRLAPNPPVDRLLGAPQSGGGSSALRRATSIH